MNVVNLKPSQIKEMIKKKNLIEFNRDISSAHVKKMVESIKKCGLLRLPVIGDVSAFSEKGKVVVDGQHLCTAITKLPPGHELSKVPVIIKKYESKKQLIADIAKLNNTQKKWSDLDYLEAWYKYGSQNKNFSDYAHLYNITKSAFPQISFGVILEIYLVEGGKKDKFREGDMVLKNKENGDKIISMCNYFLEEFDAPATFMVALSRVLKRKIANRSIDFNKMRSRLRDDFRNNKHVGIRGREGFIDFIERAYTRL